MNRELILKTIRCLIAGLCFIGLLSIIGVQEREAQQFGMMLGIIFIFSFVLRNIWLTLFLAWSVFLYGFFKFKLGDIYLSNIFYGCVLFYLAKLAFEKKHINFFINGILWWVFANILYISVQVLGYDFIYMAFRTDGKIMQNTIPAGFMGNTGYLGCLLAFSMPLLATRGSKMAIIGAIGLFVPLCLANSTLAIGVAAIGLLFVLFFRLPRWVWVLVLISFIVFTCFYEHNLDSQRAGVEVRLRHWETALRYAMQHPVTGWGMDSYRNVTEEKNFVFRQGGRQWWDNPHNIFVSLFFEFGGIGLLLLGGYLRECVIRFNKNIKEPNTIALFGSLVMVLLLSVGHFPMFLARCTVFIIPTLALFEVQTDG